MGRIPIPEPGAKHPAEAMAEAVISGRPKRPAKNVS
jgi:hypothetical protein